MMSKSMSIRVMVILTVVVFSTQCVQADLITLIHEGTGNATLDGVSLGVVDFSITAHGDTDDRQSFDNGYWIEHLSASIWIDGLGDLDFLSPTRHFVNNRLSIVGFSRGNRGSDLLDGPTDGAFGTWDMLGPIGPVSGSGELLQWSSIPTINTTGGILTFDSDPGISTTFTAIVVPEPATLMLFGLGGLMVHKRRREEG